MAPSILADPPEEETAFVHRLTLLLGGLIGLLAAGFGIAGFVYFVLL